MVEETHERRSFTLNNIESQVKNMRNQEEPYVGMPLPALGGKMREPMMMDPLAELPLAMAYVPWQSWCETYKPAQALHRGTIFPELDLPFLAGGDR
jgi:hypothetical protein